MRTKQKLILMLLALFTSIGAWAGVTSLSGINQNKCYTVTCQRSSWAVANDGTNLTTIAKLGLAFSNTDAKQQFAFVEYNGEYYLWSVNANKFITSSNTLTNVASNVEPIYFADASSFQANTVRVYFNENKNINVGGSNQITIDGWATADAGCAYEIAEAVDFDPSVALNVLNPTATLRYVISDDNGTVFTSDALSATIGDVITTLPSEYQRPYCNYSVTEKTIVAGENIVSVAVTYDLPFTVSTSFDDATWYYATLRNTKYLRADDGNKDGSGRYTTSSTNEKTDVYKWAFFGNPYSYFYIANKGQGEGKYLYAGTAPEFQTVADPTSTNAALWEATANDTGFTLRSITGASLYINDADNGGNIGYWNSSWGATDGGSKWTIEEVPVVAVNVTYDLYVGGEKVDTYVDVVAPNSSVEVPSSLTANYSTLAYNISTTGTIGNTDCTITVTATLKDGIVLPDALSNNKKYTLVCNRGALATYTDSGTAYLASPANSALGIDAAGEFAIINFEGNKYLYSVGDAKFVTYQSAQIAPLAANVTGTSDAISFSQTTNSVYEIRFDNSASKILNSSGNYTYGIVINNWGANAGEWDDGCQYIICEAGDFDPTDALAALDDFFNGPTAFANAIAELKAIPFGTGLNEYSFTGAYASYTVDNITALESAGYSPANLATAQDMLAHYTINLPTTGFYLFKSNATGKYIGFAESGSQPMVEAGDACIYYYTADKRFLSYNKGRYLTAGTGNPVAAIGTEGGTFNFFESAYSNKTLGTYRIRETTENYGSLIDWTDGFLNGWGAGDNARCEWTIETVDALPVTINSIDGRGYASFYTPVSISSLPGGVKAYIATIENNRVQFSAIEDIPAGTAVVLYMPECNANTTVELPIGDASANTEGNVLLGTAATVAPAGEVLTMQSVNGDLGFYGFNGDYLAGFKAYINSTSGIKGFSFDFEDSADGIETIQNAETNAHMNVYDLQGRKVNANGKLPKGIYIENGKKVLK